MIDLSDIKYGKLIRAKIKLFDSANICNIILVGCDNMINLVDQ